MLKVDHDDDLPVTPVLCFVGNQGSNVEAWLFPFLWLYMELALTVSATIALSWAAYRRLTAGSSESILARIRIIVVNFRNILFMVIIYDGSVTWL